MISTHSRKIFRGGDNLKNELNEERRESVLKNDSQRAFSVSTLFFDIRRSKWF